MSEKLPMIVNGNFSFGYYETSNKKEVEQYYEVDLGELNLIKKSTDIFSKYSKSEKEARSHTDIEQKTYNYHRDEDLLIPVIQVLNELKIGAYTSNEQVVGDHDSLSTQLLKAGYFLRGTKTACLLKTEIPTIDHPDFEYFFAAKLYLVSKKLSRIDKFLDFQMHKFLEKEKSTSDFKQFLKLAIRQYERGFNFSEQAMETINEWVDTAKETLLDGISSKTKNSEIQWTGNKVDLIKIIYAAFYNEDINKGKGQITKITQKIFESFGLDYTKSESLLYASLNKCDNLGHEERTFLDRLNEGYTLFQNERKERQKKREKKRKVKVEVKD